MREILFRGKREDTGEWAYGYYSALPDVAGAVYMIESPAKNPDERNITYFVNCSTVGQFTGLHDKNGKRIFEGDMIRDEFCNANGVVKFGEYANPCSSPYTCNVGFSVEWAGSGAMMLRKDLGHFCKYQEIVIIGNIHDNPELLGGNEGG